MPAQIDDLRTLIALVEMTDSPRTRTECARILNVDDGTLTSSMKRLGTEFKRQIWDPSGRYPVVTEEGYELYEHAKRFLAAVQGERLVEFLTVQVADSIAGEVLPGAVCEFLVAHRAEVKLRFRKLNYHTIRNDIMNGRSAFGIGWGFRAETSNLIVPFKPAVDMAVITPPGHPFAVARVTGVTAKELQEETVFVLQPELRSAEITRFVDQLPPQRRIECPNYYSVLRHTLEGVGIGLVPAWRAILDRLQRENALYCFPLPKKYRQHVVAYLPTGGIEALDTAARTLYQAIQRNIAALRNGD